MGWASKQSQAFYRSSERGRCNYNSFLNMGVFFSSTNHSVMVYVWISRVCIIRYRVDLYKASCQVAGVSHNKVLIHQVHRRPCCFLELVLVISIFVLCISVFLYQVRNSRGE